MNTGGPAFPQHGWSKDPEVLRRMKDQGGMTLLDYMAGQALLWCLSEFAGNPDEDAQYATAAYQIAEKMLAEKARREADHSPDAGKMASLEAANRELVSALSTMEMWVPTYCENPVVAEARAILAKHKSTA